MSSRFPRSLCKFPWMRPHLLLYLLQCEWLWKLNLFSWQWRTQGSKGAGLRCWSLYGHKTECAPVRLWRKQVIFCTALIDGDKPWQSRERRRCIALQWKELTCYEIHCSVCFVLIFVFSFLSCCTCNHYRLPGDIFFHFHHNFNISLVIDRPAADNW